MRLKAIKPLTYATRRLLPGDIFEASRNDTRILLAIKKVERVRDPVDVPPPPPSVAAKIAAAVVPPPPNDPNPPASPPTPDLAETRAEYEAAVGRRPFMGWDLATLREKIAAAKAGASA